MTETSPVENGSGFINRGEASAEAGTLDFKECHPAHLQDVPRTPLQGQMGKQVQASSQFLPGGCNKEQWDQEMSERE